MNNNGYNGTSRNYIATLRSFRQFRKGEDLPITSLTGEIATAYEDWLLSRGLKRNTTSMYMRVLRAIYNRAVNQGLTENKEPFKNVYTGVDKTVKRAMPLSVIKKIKTLRLPLGSSLDWARDMFLFSFYTRGMSFVDMAYLKKSDLQNNTLTYCRHKTGQKLCVGWERCMQKIVDKYDTSATSYLLPIIKTENGSERRQYENALHLINRKLKTIARLAGINAPLSTYVARHSWASAAKAKNIPLAVISDCLGHDSETTTQIYLASLNNETINRANKLILRDL